MRNRDKKSIYEMRTMSDADLHLYRMQLRAKRERARKVKMFSLAVLATVVLAVICTLAYGSLKTNANQGYKYYTSITVEDGDTLWTLADQYIDYNHYKDKEVYLAEVMTMNRLKDDGIYSGQTLIMPYYSMDFVY